MRHFRIKLILFLLGVSACVYGQSSNYASWKDLDTVRFKSTIDSVSNLNIQVKELSKTNKEAALKLCSHALKMAVKIHDLRGMADCYNNMGIIYKNLGEYSVALNYHLKALNLRMIVGDKKLIARSCNNLALVYANQNDLIKALEYQLKGLKIKEEINDTREISISYANIGLIYSDQKNHKMALEYFFKALMLDIQFKDSVGISFDYKGIGTEYYKMGNLELAKLNQERALKIKLSLRSIDKELTDLYNNLANIEADTKNFNMALVYYRKSLELNNLLEDKKAVAISEANIGTTLIDIENYNEAEEYLVKSLHIANEIKARNIQISIYEQLMILYERTRNFSKAYEASKLFKKLSDESSLTNNFEKLNELGIKYETDKKEKEIKLLNKDKDLKTIEIAHQKSVRNYFVGLALIILISTFFIFHLYKNKQKDNVLLKEQKEEIEIQKKSITDSINYAYRSQKSISPSQEHFYEILPQSFVLNKPKDIVSGDFYWLHETSPFKYSSVNSKVLLALADCTGHGVPGAFMSMMGVELLNEAVNESHSPAKILQIVDEGIRKALHTNNIDSKKDGMDMALCAFDFEKNVLKFCGANRPVYRIRNNVLDIFLPQKTAVGFSEQGFVFVNQEIDIQKNDAIYLFSDGYADQFGGERDKKLTTKKFKDLLMSIQAIPIHEQGLELDKFITNWAGTRQQVDDMLVIGLRV